MNVKCVCVKCVYMCEMCVCVCVKFKYCLKKQILDFQNRSKCTRHVTTPTLRRTKVAASTLFDAPVLRNHCPLRERTHWLRIRNAGREEKLLLCDSWLKEVLHRRLTNLIISGYQPRLCKRHCGYSTTRAHMRNLTTGSFIWALLDESSSHRDPLVRVGHPESLARVERKHNVRHP